MDNELCPRTNKPRRLCCQGRPWRDMTLMDMMRYDEPLPQIVIDAALRHSLDPHAVMDDVEDRGWETHDRGFDEQVIIGAERLAEDSKPDTGRSDHDEDSDG